MEKSNDLPLGGWEGGSCVGLGPLKDMCLRAWPVLMGQEFSKVEFRLSKSAELLGFKVAGKRGGMFDEGRSRRGGNGGGDTPSRGGNIGALGACRAYIVYYYLSINNLQMN